MRKTVLLCFYVIMMHHVEAQHYTTDKSEYSFSETHFFSNYRIGTMLGNSPAFKVTEENPSKSYKNASTMIGIINLGYNPRVNFKDFQDKASLSITVPVDFSLGLAVSTPDDDINTGFFTLASGVFIDFNMGYQSTYNNIDTRGLSAGLGMRVFKSPLFGIPDADVKFSRLSVGPSLKFEYKFDEANGHNRILYLETGIPRRVDAEYGSFLSNVYVSVGIGKKLRETF